MVPVLDFLVAVPRDSLRTRAHASNLKIRMLSDCRSEFTEDPAQHLLLACEYGNVKANDASSRLC